MNVTKSLFIPILLSVFSGCSEKAELVSNSPLESSINPVSVSNLQILPDSIFRPELPVSGQNLQFNFSIDGILNSTLSGNYICSVELNPVSGSTYKKDIPVELVAGNNNLHISSNLLIDDEILYGSSSSLKISDGTTILYSTSPVFKFKFDAKFDIKIDSVVFEPKNSVKIGENFKMTAYVSYNGNPNKIISVSYTGTDPNGTALTQRVFTVTGNPKVWIYLPGAVPPGTIQGAYKRNFTAKDKYGNISPVFATTHSVTQ